MCPTYIQTTSCVCYHQSCFIWSRLWDVTSPGANVGFCKGDIEWCGEMGCWGESPSGVTRKASASGGVQRKGNPGGVRLPVGWGRVAACFLVTFCSLKQEQPVGSGHPPPGPGLKPSFDSVGTLVTSVALFKVHTSCKLLNLLVAHCRLDLQLPFPCWGFTAAFSPLKG